MVNFEKYITVRTPWGDGFEKKRMVNQPEIVNYIKNNPGKTENEIMYSVYGYDRGSSIVSNKKYADCLRRALRSGKICRTLVQKGNKKVFIYFKV